MTESTPYGTFPAAWECVGCGMPNIPYSFDRCPSCWKDRPMPKISATSGPSNQDEPVQVSPEPETVTDTTPAVENVETENVETAPDAETSADAESDATLHAAEDEQSPEDATDAPVPDSAPVEPSTEPASVPVETTSDAVAAQETAAPAVEDAQASTPDSAPAVESAQAVETAPAETAPAVELPMFGAPVNDAGATP